MKLNSCWKKGPTRCFYLFIFIFIFFWGGGGRGGLWKICIVSTPIFKQKWRKCRISTPIFHQNWAKCFDPPPPFFFFTLVAFRVDGRWWAWYSCPRSIGPNTVLVHRLCIIWIYGVRNYDQFWALNRSPLLIIRSWSKMVHCISLLEYQ